MELLILQRIDERIMIRLHMRQFGFVEGRETSQLVAMAQARMKFHIDSMGENLGRRRKSKRMEPKCTFIDISGAFDSIDYAILIKQMEQFGIEDDDINLVKWYLN